MAAVRAWRSAALAAVLAAGCATPGTDGDSRSRWEHALATLTPGMSPEEVHRILPPLGSGWSSVDVGGSTVETYAVSARWLVTVGFASNGLDPTSARLIEAAR